MMYRTIAAGLAVAAMATGPALAQQATKPSQPLPPKSEAFDPAAETPMNAPKPADAARATSASPYVMAQREGNILSTDLIGHDVESPTGDTLGEVSAFEIDPQGRIVAYVIDVGGFLGVGAKQVAIPADRVQHNFTLGGESKLMLNASAEGLESAPVYMTLLEKKRKMDAAKAEEQSSPRQSTGAQPTQ